MRAGTPPRDDFFAELARDTAFVLPAAREQPDGTALRARRQPAAEARSRATRAAPLPARTRVAGAVMLIVAGLVVLAGAAALLAGDGSQPARTTAATAAGADSLAGRVPRVASASLVRMAEARRMSVRRALVAVRRAAARERAERARVERRRDRALEERRRSAPAPDPPPSRTSSPAVPSPVVPSPAVPSSAPAPAGPAAAPSGGGDSSCVEFPPC